MDKFKDLKTIGDRVKYKRIKLNMTQEDVANIVKVSKQTIQKYENNIITNIPSDRIELLAKALNCSPGYLMGWEEEQINIFSFDNIRPMPEMKKVPRLGTIACGEPILANEEHGEFDTLPIEIKCDFTLKCKGDSMINARIYDGDIVAIKAQPTVENGEIAAVIIEDEATLKRVYQIGDTLILHAENPSFADLQFHGEELNQIRILGKAVYFISQVR